MKRVDTDQDAALADALHRALASPVRESGVEQLVADLRRAESSGVVPPADADTPGPGQPPGMASPAAALLEDTTERIEELFGLPTSLARLVAEGHLDAETGLLLHRRLRKRARARADGASRIRLLVLSASLVMLTLVWLLG